MAKCEPIYETHPGFEAMTETEWIEMANKSRVENIGFGALTQDMLNYVRRIEKLSGIPIVSIGVGPDRDASIASIGGPFDI